MASDKRAARLGVLGLVATLLLGALGARLWFLQTVEATELQAQVDRDRTERRRIAPERGQIFDVDGRLLAGNQRVINVAVAWKAIEKPTVRAAIFQRLSGWLKTPVAEMEARYDSGVYDPLQPLPIAEDIDEATWIAIAERQEDFPGITLQPSYRRVYPYAPLASHVVGYMGAITAEDAEHYRDLGYDTSNRGEDVGRAGVEASYEEVLHGDWGFVDYEIDSDGRIIRELGRKEPVNGKDVMLSIDLDLQQYAERMVQTGLRIRRQFTAENPRVEKPDGTIGPLSPNHGPRVYYEAPAGSAVVLNHSTGMISAMASYPTFDNRWFGAGISGDKFEELFSHPLTDSDGNVLYDDNGNVREDPDEASLLNRATQGRYNLGSTFKPFVAYSAWMSGLLSAENEWYVDDGYYTAQTIDEDTCLENGGTIKCTWRNSWCSDFNRPCWYGDIDVYWSLAMSSDAYYYRIGEMMYAYPNTDHELLSEWLTVFGYGERTGIDLPDEWNGRVPDQENKAALVELGVLHPSEVPQLLLGDVINLSIGQGLLGATPLQLATAYGTIANGGYVMTPRVVQAIYEPNTPAGVEPGTVDLARGTVDTWFDPTGRAIEMPAEIRDRIVGGLRQNVIGANRNGRSTTAGELFNHSYNGVGEMIPVAGKTGTAQGGGQLPWEDSSVFAGFSTDPQRPYTVVAYLEKAGYGSLGGAPVVKCMFVALSDPTTMPAVNLAPPLDLDSDEAAPDQPLADTTCMRSTTAGTLSPSANTTRPED